ncbi:MAG: DUF1186 domain-containing protein [Chitinophagales bacterium]
MKRKPSMIRVDGAPNYVYADYYKKTGIRITGEPLNQDNLPPALKREQKKLHSMVTGWQSKKAIPRLEELIDEYPNVPSFKNYLYIAYQKTDRNKEAEALLEMTLEEHPDYIFGITNKILNIHDEEEIRRYSHLLGEPRDIRTVRPNYDLYHITEFVNYQLAAAHYELLIGELDAATFRLDDLVELGEDNERVQALYGEINIARIVTFQEKLEKQKEFIIEVESFPKVNYEPTKKAPLLQHSELKVFYQKAIEDFSPKEACNLFDKYGKELIPDLEAMVEDSIRRYEHLSKSEFDSQKHSFLAHALYFLGALEAEESLQKVLDILRMGEGFCKFWFEFDISRYLLPTVYFLGQNQLPALKEFVLEENISCWNKSVVSAAVEQVAYHQTERREEVIAWFREVMVYFIGQPKNEKLIDTIFLTHLIAKVTDLRAVELLPLVEQLFEKNWIDETYRGDLKMHQTDIREPWHESALEPMPLNIEEFYTGEYLHRKVKPDIPQEELERIERLLKSKGTKGMMDMLVELIEGIEGNEQSVSKKLPPKRKSQSIPKEIGAPKKVSRNAPCPCGSGKKYKRCCMNK